MEDLLIDLPLSEPSLISLIPTGFLILVDIVRIGLSCLITAPVVGSFFVVFA